MCGFGSGTIYKVGVQYITTMYWQRLPAKYIVSAQYINTFLWSMQSVTVSGYILQHNVYVAANVQSQLMYTLAS